MPGSYPKFKAGPLTYEVSGVVHGGRVVQIDGTTGKVKESAGGADALGVALTDAAPASALADTNDVFGNPIRNEYTVSKYTAVSDFGVHALITDSAVAFGDYVKPAANGHVTKATVTTGVPEAYTLGKVVSTTAAAVGETVNVRLNLR